MADSSDDSGSNAEQSGADSRPAADRQPRGRRPDGPADRRAGGRRTGRDAREGIGRGGRNPREAGRSGGADGGRTNSGSGFKGRRPTGDRFGSGGRRRPDDEARRGDFGGGGRPPRSDQAPYRQGRAADERASDRSSDPRFRPDRPARKGRPEGFDGRGGSDRREARDRSSDRGRPSGGGQGRSSRFAGGSRRADSADRPERRYGPRSGPPGGGRFDRRADDRDDRRGRWDAGRGGYAGPERRGEQRGPERGSRIREEDIDATWPELPEWAEPGELPEDVRRDLRGLSKEGAEFVAGHLVAASALAEDDPELAWRHARAARSRGGRIAVVRETVGLVAYRAGQWQEAIAELRAARRMGGGPGHLAVMADSERALGQPDRALELGRSAEAEQLDDDGRIELTVVLAGARADLGQIDAALVALEQAGVARPDADPRLLYAYGDLLQAAGRRDEALTWFVRAYDADVEEDTDAADRIAELTGPSTDTDTDGTDTDGTDTDTAGAGSDSTDSATATATADTERADADNADPENSR